MLQCGDPAMMGNVGGTVTSLGGHHTGALVFIVGWRGAAAPVEECEVV